VGAAGNYFAVQSSSISYKIGYKTATFIEGYTLKAPLWSREASCHAELEGGTTRGKRNSSMVDRETERL